jgi:putative glycosyltransferase
MELSIVTTLYCSAPYIDEFYSRSCAAAEKITGDFELLFVNDGSPDNSLQLAVELCKRDPRVKVIDLSRNFGHHKAMMTGLAHTRGRLVFLNDCDLEVDPEVLIEFHRRFQGGDVDVVYGVQTVRQDRLRDRIAGNTFYAVFNWLSPDRVPPNSVTTRLMSQQYVSALVAHQERELEIGGLWVTTGFEQVPLVVTKSWKGQSAYNLKRKIAVFVNAVTSFSNRPLVFIFYLGTVISLLAGMGALFVMIRHLFFGALLAGWPSLIVSIWLVGGLMIFCVGIIGIYLSKIFTETKQRPYTIIRKIYQQPRTESQLCRPTTSSAG